MPLWNQTGVGIGGEGYVVQARPDPDIHHQINPSAISRKRPLLWASAVKVPSATISPCSSNTILIQAAVHPHVDMVIAPVLPVPRAIWRMTFANSGFEAKIAVSYTHLRAHE